MCCSLPWRWLPGSRTCWPCRTSSRCPATTIFAVQQIYRGWARLGIVVFTALATTLPLAVMERGNRARFRLAGATACIALSLVVFFTFTYPANQQTENWAVMPDNWEGLRRQWEYSHAAGAGLYFVALTALTRSLLVGRESSEPSAWVGERDEALPAGGGGSHPGPDLADVDRDWQAAVVAGG